MTLCDGADLSVCHLCRHFADRKEVVSLAGYGDNPINAIGVLFDAKPGNDYCNGQIAPIVGSGVVGACMCDCLHLDDVLVLLKEKGWDKRPEGK